MGSFPVVQSHPFSQNMLPSLREGRTAGRCTPTPCLASSLLDTEAQREEPQVISRPRNASPGSLCLGSAALASSQSVLKGLKSPGRIWKVSRKQLCPDPTPALHLP